MQILYPLERQFQKKKFKMGLWDGSVGKALAEQA